MPACIGPAARDQSLWPVCLVRWLQHHHASWQRAIRHLPDGALLSHACQLLSTWGLSSGTAYHEAQGCGKTLSARLAPDLQPCVCLNALGMKKLSAVDALH